MKLIGANNRYSSQQGILLLEVIVGIAVFFGVFLAFYNLSYQLGIAQRETVTDVQVTALMTAALEGARAIRDDDWATFAGYDSDQDYYVVHNGTDWILQTTPIQILNGYNLSVRLSDVYRDANDDIADSGTLDTNTRLVTVTVSWTDSRGTERQDSMSEYLTNLFE